MAPHPVAVILFCLAIPVVEGLFVAGIGVTSPEVPECEFDGGIGIILDVFQCGGELASFLFESAVLAAQTLPAIINIFIAVACGGFVFVYFLNWIRGRGDS